VRHEHEGSAFSPAANRVTAGPLPHLEYHHLGVACEDPARDAAAFAALGYAPETSPIDDHVQGVRVQFLTGPGPRLELVAPLAGGRTPLTAVLAQRIKLYHMAFITDRMNEDIETLRRGRAKLVAPPLPAAAFGGRPIAFVCLPNRVLVEPIASG